MEPKITIQELYRQFNEARGDGLQPLHLLTIKEAQAWVEAGLISPLIGQAWSGQILPIQLEGLMPDDPQ